MTQPAFQIPDRAYVDGAWIGGPAFDVTDKATGDVIARVPDLGVDETRHAIDAAHRAFALWSKTPAVERSAILRRWADLIVTHADDLALVLTREQGKPIAEARGEILYGAGFIGLFAEQAKRIHGETIASPKPDSRILVLKQPIGVVAAITPWNFPNAMIARKVSPALAAGCTIVVKPAEETPLSALALALLAERAGFPPGVFNVVITNDPASVGRELSESPQVRMVTFTGSTEVGKLLMRQAAGTVKRVGLELGGNAPFIVFDDADLDQAVAGAMASKFRNAGQTCVCANRIFVQAAVYDEFVARFKVEVSRLKVGCGIEDGVEVGPLIGADAVAKVERHLSDATSKGAEVIIGGRRHARGGTFFEPTIVTGLRPDMEMFREETFGPVAALMRFETEADVIRLANDTPYGLAAYFYARDIGRVWRVAEALDCGVVGVNAGIISSEYAPFGGTKESGLGREGSHHGIEEFLEMKYVLMAGLGPA